MLTWRWHSTVQYCYFSFLWHSRITKRKMIINDVVVIMMMMELRTWYDNSEIVKNIINSYFYVDIIHFIKLFTETQFVGYLSYSICSLAELAKFSSVWFWAFKVRNQRISVLCWSSCRRAIYSGLPPYLTRSGTVTGSIHALPPK